MWERKRGGRREEEGTYFGPLALVLFFVLGRLGSSYDEERMR